MDCPEIRRPSQTRAGRWAGASYQMGLEIAAYGDEAGALAFDAAGGADGGDGELLSGTAV